MYAVPFSALVIVLFESMPPCFDRITHNDLAVGLRRHCLRARGSL